MPSLRLYSAEVPIEQKRIIAQKLIEITMHAFCLRPEERYQISIEFIPEPKSSAASWVGRRSSLRDADCLFEVLGRDLTEEKKRVFAGETTVVLTPLLPLKSKMRIARLLGVKPDISPQNCFSVWRTQPGNQRTLRCTFQFAGCISSSRVSHKRRAGGDGR